MEKILLLLLLLLLLLEERERERERERKIEREKERKRRITGIQWKRMDGTNQCILYGQILLDQGSRVRFPLDFS